MTTPFNANENLFQQADLTFIRSLIQENQGHLLSQWPAPGKEDEGKHKLVAQLQRLNTNVTGGLVHYIRRARRMLKEASDGVNPLHGFVPSVPSGVKLNFGSKDYEQYEQAGVLEAGRSAFVLVAGGLGERLGYSGIKVALPAESATMRSYLQLYAENILALQARAREAGNTKCLIPFAIMTSDDTHEKTIKFLEENEFFGLEGHHQVSLIKQEKVPCFSDNECRLALSDQYTIQTKPHGHGDVHGLLHSSGLARKWHEEGLQWICFFQDTNGLVFHGILPALGISAHKDYDMNSVAVPRKAKEAVGGITKLWRESDGFEMTVNVEYNQLDPLLRTTISPEGDINDETGNSPYPGNINQLVLKVGPYCAQLERTGGIISEYVNPKYADETKTSFKSSTRLECMMQDYPRSLPESANVGFTLINQVWATYSSVKNSIEAARSKAAEGVPPKAAVNGEAHMYEYSCQALSLIGANIGEPVMATYSGLSVEMYPRVVWSPRFALTLDDLRKRINAKKVNISTGSVLILDGDIHIDGLDLDGCLVANSTTEQVVIRDKQVKNRGWEWVELLDGEEVSEEMAIRGFQVVKHATEEV